MKKRDPKVEEPQAPYFVGAASSPKSQPGESDPPTIRYADVTRVRETNEKLIKIHHKVLRKLAQ